MIKPGILIALLLFCGTILFAQNQNKTATEMTVMSFNIRYDNPGDGINRWDNRKERVASLIDFYHPDIIGLQEALKHQIKYLQDALDDYEWVGVGRDDGKDEGEFSPVFYNSKALELLDWGTFWLSKNPEKPSTGWDAALPRVCTWATFKTRSGGKELAFFNTHFDHRGETAREESSKLIITKIKKLSAPGSPVVLLGDFNQTPDSPGYDAITSSLHDASKEPLFPAYGPEGTFSGFEAGQKLGNRIDHIFLSKDIKCKKFRTITDNDGLYYPSDHLPVLAEIILQ